MREFVPQRLSHTFPFLVTKDLFITVYPCVFACFNCVLFAHKVMHTPASGATMVCKVLTAHCAFASHSKLIENLIAMKVNADALIAQRVTMGPDLVAHSRVSFHSRFSDGKNVVSVLLYSFGHGVCGDALRWYNQP